MNRIYKVIWSKVKHQYVVVSEFAHSCTKSTGSRVGRSAAAVLAALVLTIGVGSVQANFIEKEDDPTYNPNYDNIIVIDGGTKANSTISVGKGAFTEEGSDGSIAIGVSSRVNGNAGSSIALGYNAHVAEEAKDSIAIGHNSKATEADTVSVGNAETGLKRRVTNAADAIFKEGSSDLVTAGQLDAVGIVPGTVITPGNHNTAIGDAAWIGGGASNNIAIGNGEGGMHGWIGANRHNSVSINGVVHGSQAIAVGENSWIGSDADGSIALGVGARVEGKDSNKGITVAATDSIAIGHNATVVPEANNSIAVGADSKATEANTFSIGSEGNERKLVNVANGTNAHDGVTVGQLQAASDEATKTIHGVTLDHGTISTSVTSFGTDSLTFDDSGLTISNSSFAGVDGTTNIKGNTITTEVVKGLTNTSWDGTTIDRSRAATEGQLADLNKTVSENAKGVVKWDEGTNDTIHGVELAGDGAISAASDRFSVDRYGNIAAQTYGGQGDDTNYYFNMNHADGISMGYSNGTSMNIDPLGVHFKVGEQETLINGNTVVTGRVNADTVQADAMYVGNQEQGNAVVTQNQLTDDISAATKGMVKWDTATDADGNTTYTEGVLHGLKLEGETDGSSTFSTISQVNGNSEITMNKSSVIITADTTDENGNQVNVSKRGTALISGDNAVLVKPNKVTIGNKNNGGMTVDSDGSVSYTSSNNDGTTVVDGGVITVSNGLDGEEAKNTTISDDQVETGTLRAHNGLIASGYISMNDKGASLLMTGGKVVLKAESQDGQSSITLDKNGTVSLKGGYQDATKVDVNGDGLVVTDRRSALPFAKTTIKGDSITTGSVTGLKNTEWTGTTNDESRAATEGQLVDLSEDLNTSIDTATKGVVKWDGLNENTNSIHGVVLSDLGNGNGRVETEELTAGYDNDKLTVNSDGIQMNTHVDGTHVPILSDIIGSDINGSDTTLSMSNGGFNMTSKAVTGELVMDPGLGFIPTGIKGSIDSASMSMDKGEIEMTSSSTGGEASLQEGLDGWLNREATLSMKDGEIQMTASEGLTTDTVVDVTTDGLTVSDGNPALPGTTSTNIKGNTITTGTVHAGATVMTDGSVTGLKNTEWTGKASDETRAATEGQLADLSEDLNTSIDTATKGVVKWDGLDEKTNSIHGVTLKDGTVSTGGVTADKYGNIYGEGSLYIRSDAQESEGYSQIDLNKDQINFKAGSTEMFLTRLGAGISVYGTQADEDGNYPNTNLIVQNGNVTIGGAGDHPEFGNEDWLTVTADGSTFESNGTTTTIKGDSITTGSVTGLTNTKWDEDDMVANRAATEGQLADLSTTVAENMKDVVKWDDADQDSIHGVGLEEGGRLTATTISANHGHFTVDGDGLTMTRSNGQDVFTVDENGAVTAAGGLFKISDGGDVSGKTMNGTFFNMDDNGIMMGLTADDGQTPGTTVQVTNNGVLFTDGKSEMGTTINGNTIHTGSITATGTSTLGDVKIGEGLVDGVDVSELKTSFGELDKNAVKWDNADQNSIHGVGLAEGGRLTATTISANHGHFTVDGDGLTMTRSNGQDVFTVDENGAVTAAGGLFKISDGGDVSGKTMNGTFFNMDDNGIMMGLTADDGQTPGTTVQVTNNGVLFTDGKSEMGTTINGNTIHTGSITATGTSTLGGVKIGEGLVDGVDVSGLATSVGTLDQNAVKYDEDGSLHAGKEGTGQLDLNADGSASITSSKGNGFTANTDGTNTITGDTNIDGTLAVENGANINGGASISGGASITGGLTVDGVDIGGSVADVSANVEEIKGDVAQNATDISGIKDQIGATGENGALNLSNGATTIESGINTNTSSIKTINDNIGATGENGALKLSNGATTIESGINANTTMIQQNSQAIGQLGHKVGELDSRIDEVGAGAAALAALHPLDFDPDAKWDFAAGYGNYRGENAVAVGTFYRPNEDTMFSVGGTFGNDDNMVNAGVSFKIGAGSSHVTTSRTAMAKEIKSMRDIVAKQDAQIQKLTAMVNALVGVQTKTDTTTMFPDVPENHWAYEAVAAMAKSGLVKGYPDGEFKGDRNMTRYEFAQIVYNAIQAGAEVDARLVEEFKPELEYFHIATVAKDKDGNPTIERVRAN